ncbi:MAG: carboxypeptidase-like regulatory domain-containing protein, partial [Acidobacteriota bacterium]
QLCTGNNWTPGNAGSANSHWQERDFIAYRMLFSGIAAGTNTVIIGYDRIHSGKHAIDYLGSYNATEPSPGNDPCSGVTGCTGWTVSPVAVPVDPLLPVTIPQVAGVFTMWGATFVGSPTYVPCGVSDESLVRCVRIQFAPQSGVTSPVMAWGGHIAWRGEWGTGQSAGGISGSPYHSRLEELNGSGGNQDRSLSAQGVVGPGSLRIIKSVTTNPFGTSSTVEFWFTADKAFAPATFALIDDDPGPGIDNKLSDSILTYNGVANVITVTEDTALFPVGQNWSFNGLTCTVNGAPANPTFPTVTAGSTRGVTVTVPIEGVVVCTFNNTQVSPSAAPATISGRVIDSFGTGIGRARLTVTDAQSGGVFSAVTNPFGYYTIEGTEVGNFYVMTISHKGYTFADDTRSFTLHDNLAGVDFIANP